MLMMQRGRTDGFMMDDTARQIKGSSSWMPVTPA
jgi:hypothetical protein